jgi:hypothetical protein
MKFSSQVYLGKASVHILYLIHRNLKQHFCNVQMEAGQGGCGKAAGPGGGALACSSCPACPTQTEVYQTE